MRATGLFRNSPLLTNQSSAFLSTPGTPCAYSGLQISHHLRRTAIMTSKFFVS